MDSHNFNLATFLLSSIIIMKIQQLLIFSSDAKKPITLSPLYRPFILPKKEKVTLNGLQSLFSLVDVSEELQLHHGDKCYTMSTTISRHHS
ncbi:unnamed protein product [Lupinus luteus]|uniref:Uncharacterized protein n=1 Tax=Lupinus luteus TaxID=3873 RepID=A0AAV1WZG8_LUPLU